MGSADTGDAVTNAAVAAGQLTVDEDVMWKAIFDDDSENTPAAEKPSK